jgi:F-type H+-transporting ATPase subunit delta
LALRGAAARRYAQALYSIAADSNTLDAWLNDLKALNTVLGDPSLVSMLEDPKLTEAERDKAVGDGLAKVKIGPLALNFVKLLVRRQRLGLLPRILQEYQAFYNRARGIVVAEVVTATPLDEARRRKVAADLSRMTGKSVELVAREDPRIMGGLIARIGDELIDVSVASRLASLAEKLS